MTFEEAITEAKKGKTVHRLAWYDDMIITFDKRYCDETDNVYLTFGDMLADDWELKE